MNHPHEDQLLLLAYGDLPAAETAETEAHLATCDACRTQFGLLERSRVALDWVVPQERRRSGLWIAAGLAAAAAVAAVVLTGGPSQEDRPRSWPEQHEWSATAGYIAGGQPLITIDAQLTRLEQERSYARP
jgi:anti-sigma factor RsiW